MNYWQERQQLEQRAKQAEYNARKTPTDRNQQKARIMWVLFDNFRKMAAERMHNETTTHRA